MAYCATREERWILIQGFVLPISLVRFIKSLGIQTVMPVPRGCESERKEGKTQAAEFFFGKSNEKILLSEISWEIKLWGKAFVCSPQNKKFENSRKLLEHMQKIDDTCISHKDRGTCNFLVTCFVLQHKALIFKISLYSNSKTVHSANICPSFFVWF